MREAKAPKRRTGEAVAVAATSRVKHEGQQHADDRAHEHGDTEQTHGPEYSQVLLARQSGEVRVADTGQRDCGA